MLVRHFAREAARRMNRRAVWLSPATMDSLISHSWPGNIRELQNLIERAVFRFRFSAASWARDRIASDISDARS
jgi:two-component system, NtrC family, C4-dicarboxylate transport response regulator DctD